MTQEQIIRLLNKGGTLIDVREQAEFDAGHLQGAVHFPLSSMSLQLYKLRQLQKPLLLYCRSGNRSGIAASMLQSAGFEEVYNIGGISDLQALLTKKYAGLI